MILGALAVAAVVAAAAGGTPEASAKEEKDYDRGSKEAFEKECMDNPYDTVFIEDDYGDLTCYWGGGGKTVCDSNGNDCWFIDPASRVSKHPTGSVTDTLGEATLAEERDQRAPVDSRVGDVDLDRAVFATDDEP